MATNGREKVDILIVDDREDGLVALEAVLGNPAYNLVKASSGAEALELVTSHDFAVVLLDVQMPGIDGFETAARMKEREKSRHIPIIFVTAINKDDRYIFKGYETGAVDYVFKPFDPLILRSKVAVFVDLHLKNRQLARQAELIRESERRDRYRHLAQLEMENLRKYRNLADAIPHMVWKAKADGTMDYFNKKWIDYTGLSLEQSLGFGWQSAFEPEDLQVLLKVWVDAMLNGTSFETECRIRCAATGQWRWHMVRVVPDLKSAGEVVEWLGTNTEIHDRKVTENDLAIAKELADQANRAKSRFLANMSHEIRTPLSAILGFTELLSNPTQTPVERTQSLETVRRNGEQLLKIIDEILDLSKIEAERLEIEALAVDLEEILLDVRGMLALKAQEKGLELLFQIEGDVPKFLRTDPTRLRQILINLIGNAVKFTEKGRVVVHVSSLDDEGGEMVRFRVTDTGVGIAHKHRARLFQPFSQVDGSTTRKFGGTGLGLALSLRLAEALGGSLRLAESEPGKGSEFEILVPRGEADSDDRITGLRSEAEMLSEKRQEKPFPDCTGARVLLVEDASDNQALIGRFLRMAGAQVDVANNGQEALDLATSPYTVILMDIQMPVLDGFEATLRLRARGYQGPIIALTAHALKEERERCLAAGCNDHLTKPIDRRRLLETVAYYLDRQTVQAGGPATVHALKADIGGHGPTESAADLLH